MWRQSIVRAAAIGAFVKTPPGRALFRRRVLDRGYLEEKNSEEYVRRVFRTHWEACGRPTSGAVLEIGPGGNVATAQLFAEKGCDPVVCIDLMPYVDETGEIEYRSPETIEDTPLPDESFDVIYSHAALEHVFDPAAAVKSIARLLRPGGRTSHWIDLRDHRDFNEPHAFLRYPDWLWKLAGEARGWPNRWRAGDWRESFEDEGLRTEVIATDRAPLPADLNPAPRFTDELEVVGITLIAQG